MPTYNFTVRATDDTGAYADRDFSINVRNTIVDRYMVLNDTSIYGSPNLSTWSQRDDVVGMPATYNSSTFLINSKSQILFYNGRWIVNNYVPSGTATPRNFMSYSDDGINWVLFNSIKVDGEEIVLSDSNAWHIGSITVQDGKLWTYLSSTAGSGGHGTNGRLISSEDGLNWSYVSDFIFPAVSPWFALNKVGDTWYFNAKSGTSATSTIYKSLDSEGKTWTEVTLPFSILDTFRTVGMKYFNGLYIAVSNRNEYYTSVDATNWVKRTMPTMESSENVNQIVYGNGRLVMTTFFHVSSTSNSIKANINKVYVSVDGINWSESNFDSYANFTSSLPGARIVGKLDCIFSNGRFILISNTHMPSETPGIRISYDGLTWNTVTEGVPDTSHALGVMSF